jgi:RNA recognition motif-containing protein
MGYGFIEFNNKEAVIKAMKQYQNSLLDGHNLQLSISKGRKQA